MKSVLECLLGNKCLNSENAKYVIVPLILHIYYMFYSILQLNIILLQGTIYIIFFKF
jgi:hypothetical protein